jgi:ribosomal protein S18 acetylase RimI-like enzyme
MTVAILILKPGDEAVLNHVADEVFDNPVDPALAREFLADPHHHIAVAIENGIVIGFASGVDYIHPDKARELFVNEVGVTPSRHRRGIGQRVLGVLLGHASAMGCTNAWVLTDKSNDAARALYTSLGGEVLNEEPMLQFEFMQQP